MEDVNQKVNVVDFNKSRVLFAFLPLKKYIKNNHPDFLIAAMLHVNVVAFFSNVFNKKPAKFVASERNYLPQPTNPKQKLRYFFMRKAIGFIYKRSYAVTTVSESITNQLTKQLKVPAKKTFTIYNPVVNEKLFAMMNQPPQHPWLQNKNHQVVLGVGRLTKQKDFTTLIKAFDLVRNQLDAKLIILGEGEERPKLEALIHKLDLENKIDLPGFVKNPFSLMKASDLFVLSSRWEGLPGVLIQAMACGTPVISTDCPGGSREILENGKWGPLVPVGNPKALSAKIIEKLNSQTHPNVIERALCFDEETAANKYIELLGL